MSTIAELKKGLTKVNALDLLNPEGKEDGGGSITFLRASQLEANKSEPILEGVFQGTVPNQYNSDKPDFKFITDNGTVIVNSTGHLNYLMSPFDVGTLCEIYYLGKEDYKGRAVHKFKVEGYKE